MATGRDNQLTKQVGEYLVAAELCRRDLIATTFTGNVPHYDIIASNSKDRSVLIQVKTIKSTSWQFDISHFANVALAGKKQIVGKNHREPVPHLICVFVQLTSYGKDKFYVFPWHRLQNILISDYKKYLANHGGKQPRKYKSFHCTVKPFQISLYENNWQVIEKRLK